MVDAAKFTTPPSTAPVTPRPIPLTAAEIAALALALAHLGTGPQAAMARQALRSLFDARRDDHSIARRSDPGYGDHSSRGAVLSATFAGLTAPLDPTVASRAKVLAAGISNRMVVRLHYRDAKGSVSVRHVEPVTCLVHRHHWYLVAWCRLRRGVRAFRLDRVLAVEPTTSPARVHRAERFLPFQPRAAA